MARWNIIVGLGAWGAGLATGCVGLGADSINCSEGICEPTAEAEERLCPAETHTCMLYIGGGWDNVVRWEGSKEERPLLCPEAAARMSFWGDVVPDPANPPLSRYVVGCGFIEAGTCEGVVTDPTDYICAPIINKWPACVVANSRRDCPPDYSEQTIVGTDTPGDVEWTVCCLPPARAG